jgi:hypothetical protein
MHDLDAVRTYTDVWPWLLGAAICLLPLDVGIRRVMVEPADVRRAIAWLRREGKRGRTLFAWAGLFRRTYSRRRSWQKQPSVRMSRLMAAKKRAPVQHHGDEASSSVTGMPGVSPISNSSGRGSVPARSVPARVPASSKPQSVSETASPEPLPSGSAGPVVPPSPEPRLEEAEQSGGQGSTSMTARLLAAKKRAQRGDVKPPEE